MEKYEFRCYGHENVLGTHAKTLEFTKDKELSLNGDCIIGLKADFDLVLLKKFISSKEKLKLRIECSGIVDEVCFVVNSDFNSSEEIVIRKSGFVSEKTLGLWADKGAIEIDRRIIERMKKGGEMKVGLINNS